MPPAAATECERTGWTLETIPTVAPDWAAASAAPCPASPAPMISTSWDGTARDSKCSPSRRDRAHDGEHRSRTSGRVVAPWATPGQAAISADALRSAERTRLRRHDRGPGALQAAERHPHTVRRAALEADALGDRMPAPNS